MNPVYRFTAGGKIFVFGMLDISLTVQELVSFFEKFAFIKLWDGSHVSTDMIEDVRVYNVDCPVGFLMLRNGQMVKSY